jgi:outer membrane biosynthesis protein TonB
LPPRKTPQASRCRQSQPRQNPWKPLFDQSSQTTDFARISSITATDGFHSRPGSTDYDTNAETTIRGDNRSVKTGPDATTVEARPSLLAKPNYLKNPEPSYPPLARRRHQEGLVLLAVKVTAQGPPAEVALKQSSGFPC